jgi:glycosyltransferase involved in cell wall biosynthesis
MTARPVLQNNITLGITYYNKKELLTECLQSLYQCRSLPDEIIIHDDCSQFPAADYLIEDPRIKIRLLVSSKNVMLAAARNKIIEAATCNYIRFLDADDLFAPEAFFELLATVRQTSHPVVFNEVRSIDFASGAVRAEHVVGIRGHTLKSELMAIAIGGSILAPAVTYNTALGRELGGYDHARLRQGEDFDFGVRLLQHAASFTVFDGAPVIQRVRPGSMSANREENAVNLLTALEKLAQELPEYRDLLGARAFHTGRVFDLQGNRDVSDRAFRLAFSLSRRPDANESRSYRLSRSLLGLKAANWLARKKMRLKKS